MSNSSWFILGLLIGLILDLPLVKVMLRPIEKRLKVLEERNKNE